LLATTNAGMYVFDCVASDEGRGSPCRDGATRTRPNAAHSRHAAER
jgi:hypothetical protein